MNTQGTVTLANGQERQATRDTSGEVLYYAKNCLLPKVAPSKLASTFKESK